MNCNCWNELVERFEQAGLSDCQAADSLAVLQDWLDAYYPVMGSIAKSCLYSASVPEDLLDTQG